MAAWTLCALLVPCTAYSAIYHSPFVFKLLGYALAGSFAETLFALAVQRRRKLVCSGSALTAALLAASAPPATPFLPMLFAILVAVWGARLPWRGAALRFNAAMAGRFFLMLAYPAAVVAWGTAAPDTISTATPQELYRTDGFMLDWHTVLFGRVGGSWEGLYTLVPGSPGETWPLATLLLGGLLCRAGIVPWRTPLAFLLSFGIATACLGNNPLFNLFSAATVFTAVFIVTDPVSTPMGKGGQVAFGIVVGAANALIRNYTYYTEAVVYAVLLGNLLAPWLDHAAFALRGRQLGRRRPEQ